MIIVVCWCLWTSRRILVFALRSTRFLLFTMEINSEWKCKQERRCRQASFACAIATAIKRLIHKNIREGFEANATRGFKRGNAGYLRRNWWKREFILIRIEFEWNEKEEKTSFYYFNIKPNPLLPVKFPEAATHTKPVLFPEKKLYDPYVRIARFSSKNCFIEGWSIKIQF